MKKLPVFVQTGDPETVNITTANDEYPGQLGMETSFRGKRYRKVKLDSGATASTPTGAVADNDLAYWKDRTAHIVTNDNRFAPITRGFVAGVFRTAVTAGNVCFVQTGGIGDMLEDDGATVVGEIMVPSTTSAAATGIAVGTAPTHQVLGVARAADVANVVSCDIEISDTEDYTG